MTAQVWDWDSPWSEGLQGWVCSPTGLPIWGFLEEMQDSDPHGMRPWERKVERMGVTVGHRRKLETQCNCHNALCLNGLLKLVSRGNGASGFTFHVTHHWCSKCICWINEWASQAARGWPFADYCKPKWASHVACPQLRVVSGRNLRVVAMPDQTAESGCEHDTLPRGSVSSRTAVLVPRNCFRSEMNRVMESNVIRRKTSSVLRSQDMIGSWVRTF